VQILGLSSNNPFSQRTFADSLQLPFPFLSDFPSLRTIRAYGGLTRDWNAATAQRWFFLIGKQGIIRGQWRGSATDVFPSDAILKVAREHSGK